MLAVTFTDSIAALALALAASAAPPDTMPIAAQLAHDIGHTLPLVIGGFGVTMIMLGLGLLLMFRDRLDFPVFPRWRK